MGDNEWRQLYEQNMSFYDLFYIMVILGVCLKLLKLLIKHPCNERREGSEK